ncbi:MAG: TIGR01777 family protein [Marinilabiliales bacterium]|nr:MAG: TIGR01777 family protein [Marinilabiliales bacterium]
MTKVLITGGTGLVGSALSRFLKDKGFTPVILSRNPKANSEFPMYKWDVNKGEIDKAAFNGVEHIIHLAGANLGEKRWSKKRKQILIESRVKSAEFLFETIKNGNYKIKAFISASAVGIYPSYTDNDTIFEEDSKLGNSFAAEICKRWESAADDFKTIGIRTVKIRTGIVQDINDPALEKILLSAKFGILPAFGKGEHYYPWIHLKDLCRIYHTAIIDETFNGPYNAVAPDTITNKQYTKAIKKLRRKGFILHIPAFFMKLLFGEMSQIILRGTKVQSKLHKKDKFKFEFPTIESAMKDLLK